MTNDDECDAAPPIPPCIIYTWSKMVHCPVTLCGGLCSQCYIDRSTDSPSFVCASIESTCTSTGRQARTRTPHQRPPSQAAATAPHTHKPWQLTAGAAAAAATTTDSRHRRRPHPLTLRRGRGNQRLVRFYFIFFLWYWWWWCGGDGCTPSPLPLAPIYSIHPHH